MKLQEILEDEALKARFIRDGASLVEAEVATKRGLGGMAIKGGFKALKSVAPGIIPGALETLMPAFAPSIEPYFAAAQESGDVAGYFASHRVQVASAMLAVTDAKAANAKNRVMKKTYSSLRGQAQKHTEEAIPGVGRLLAGFV